MTYNVYFTYKPDAERIEPGRLRRYFQQRPLYALEQHHAWYENPATGVSFFFELFEEEQLTAATVPLGFNLHYLRPHTFAREAEPQLADFVEHFDLLIAPSNAGRASREYSRETFMGAYEAGNREAMAKLSPERIAREGIWALPYDTIDETWTWNYTRADIAERYDPSVYVPRVLYVSLGSQLFTTAMWTDAARAALPRTDKLLVPPGDLLEQTGAARSGVALLDWEDVAPFVDDFEQSDDPSPHHLVDWDQPPAGLVELLAARSAQPAEMQMVAFDKVLDAEWLDAADGAHMPDA